jgi:hypothetical protein
VPWFNACFNYQKVSHQRNVKSGMAVFEEKKQCNKWCAVEKILPEAEKNSKNAQVDVKKHSEVEKIVMIDENAKLQK